MYTCERCGTSFGRKVPVVESCPRCLARDGVRVALAFKLFQSNPRPSQGLESAVQRQLVADKRRAAA